MKQFETIFLGQPNQYSNLYMDVNGHWLNEYKDKSPNVVVIELGNEGWQRVPDTNLFIGNNPISFMTFQRERSE